MNKKISALAISAILWLGFFASAKPQDTSDQERVWVAKAQKTRDSLSYKMVEQIGIKAKTQSTRTTYQQVNPDGSVWVREETDIPGGLRSVTIINDEGTFELIGNVAVKDTSPNRRRQPQPYREKKSRIVRTDADNFSIDGRLTINRQQDPEKFKILDDLKKEIEAEEHAPPPFPIKSYMGRRCYLVRRESADRTRKEYLIDQETNLILRKRNYDANGRMTQEIACQSFQINPEFDPSLFQVPKDSTVQVAGNDNDQRLFWEKAVMQKYVPSPSRTAPVGNYLPRFWAWSTELLFAYGSYFFGALGVGLLIFCGVVKMRQRRSIR